MSKFWRYFISNGLGGRDCCQLGIHGHGVPIPNPLARRFELILPSGVEVWDVEPGGPAEQAGIQAEDIIVAVAEQPTINVDNLHKLLKKLPVGVSVPVTLLRGECRLERWVIPPRYREPVRRI